MKIRTTLAAGLAALSLGVAAAPALAWHTAGGITFDADEPYKYGTIQGDSFASGTATATGTYATSLQYYSAGVWREAATKSATLIAGVKYNFWQKATVSCDFPGTYYVQARVKATFRGVTDYSAARTITC